MGAETRPGPNPVTLYEKFAADPRRFHVFLALRILEAAQGDGPGLGRSRRPGEDPVRLGQEPTLAFPPTTISGFEAGSPARLTNLFFGLFGPHGPLPPHLTEHARERLRTHGDPTLVAFADMLTHRMMSLMFRAWATGHPEVSFDRGEGAEMERKVAALSGHMGAALAARDAMPDLAKRHFVGRLAPGPRTAEGLLALVSGFFRAPVEVQQFVGAWLELEPGDRWRLGAPGGLGRTTAIGTRVWSRTAKFRLRIGPLDLDDYRRLLPGEPSLRRLVAVVRTYVGNVLDYDVNLVLRADAVPQAVLGRDTRLGHTSWIGTRPSGTDADDLYLNPRAAA
ncbi:type VI secretion system baseplate subunit TssG [Rhodobacteraceae bacterium CCMM004]|nr:type VI secretion system baseplate subunit TssG [Rhodobacteraceae bacterium CCMM004]